MKATVLLIAGFIAVVTEPATAIDFSGVDLRPYVLFSSHLVIPTIFNPDEQTYQEQQQLITQGGAVFSSRTMQVDQKIPSTDIYRGLATPTQLRDLKNTLNAANIRGQRSCESNTLGAQSGYTDITWYSIRGKRNTFRLVFAHPGTSGLPPCRESLGLVTTALLDFELAIFQNPDTELLLTPH